jgi:hypothetical protein
VFVLVIRVCVRNSHRLQNAREIHPTSARRNINPNRRFCQGDFLKDKGERIKDKGGCGGQGKPWLVSVIRARYVENYRDRGSGENKDKL